MKLSRHRILFPVALAIALNLTGCGNSPESRLDQPLPTAPTSPAFKPSVVVEWNREVLRAVTLSRPRPTVVARSLFLLHSCIYDTWSAYDGLALGSVTGRQLRRPDSERTQSHIREAVCYAAYFSALQLFPDYEAQTGGFSDLLLRQGFSPQSAQTEALETTSPAGLARRTVDLVLASRAQDGSNAANDFADITSSTYPALYQAVNSPAVGDANAVGGPAFGLAHWTPLRVPTGAILDGNGFPLVDPGVATSFSDQRFLTPHWGAVTPFAVPDLIAIRPSGPPLPGSTEPYTDALGVVTTHEQAFTLQMNEIIALTRDLNEREKSIAEYWADGPTSDTPPGHWNEFAQDVSFRQRYSIGEDAKLFFALNGGLLDSSICCWEAKRHYDYVRPVSAIQHRNFGQTIQGWAGPGLGTQNLLGQDWRPFQRLTFVTPAFAEFTSGHSTFSACGAQILTRFTGRNDLYDPSVVLPWDRNGDGVGDILGEFRIRPGSLTIEPGLPNSEVVLRWSTLQEAADEAGISRRYGGIHFQDGDVRGRMAGKVVGDIAIEKAFRLFSGQ